MSPTQRDPARFRRAVILGVQFDSLESRTLLSFAAPVAITPGNGNAPGPVLTTLTPTFQWSAVSGVDGYAIHILDKSKGSFFDADVNGSATTTFSVTLRAGHQFVWNVRDVIGSTTGAQSNDLNFQTPTSTTPTLPAPLAISPGTTGSPGPVLTSSTVTFAWSAVGGVSGYRVDVFDKTLNAAAVGANVAAKTTSFTATLTAGHQFSWTVRSLANGIAGAPSNTLNFQTPVSNVPTLPRPTTLAPGTGTAPGPLLTTLTPTFSWVAVPAGTVFTGYQINLYDLTRRRGQTFAVDASATSFTIPTGRLIAGHSYLWNLSVLNGTQIGPASQPNLFFQAPTAATVPGPAPTVPQAVSPGSVDSPGPTLHTLTPTLLWTAVTGVRGLSGYRVNVVNQTTQRNFLFDVGATTTQFTLAAGTLVAGTAYAWNVTALVNGQAGTPSNDLFFVA